MTLLFANVSFGIFALMPLGWAFMALIIALESVVSSRTLASSWWRRKPAGAVLAANTVSGTVGFFASLKLNGGWWLVVWMPWVSGHEVDLPRHLLALSIYYVVAFVLSVAIEGFVMWLLLRKDHPARDIWRTCFLSNVWSYALGSIAMYSWSFSFE
jgi:hypothetical protein